MAEADRLASIRHVVSAQIFSRVVTFGMNIGIARVAVVSDYGIGTVSFQLFTNLALFGAKEGCRKVALRSASGEESRCVAAQSAHNVAWLGVLTTMLSCAPLVFFWLREHPEYPFEIVLLSLGAFFEALAEPFLVGALLQSDFRVRAVGEGAAILMRTLFIFAWAALSIGPLPRAFACGSVVYGVVWLCWFVRSPGAWAAAAPKVLSDGSYCLPFHRQLLIVFGRQAVLKLLLAEGEKLVLMAAFDDSAMGVFGLVSNLGSLVLRLIFAPVEEIAYAAFSKERGHASQHLPLFRTLLCLQGLLGWIGLCFGPAFAEVAIRILYGKTWLDAGAARVLALYCILLFFMALNGVCEAFVHAVASPLWMGRMQALSVGIFVALVSTALAGRSYGPIALVMANTLAMALRVALCALFLRSSEVGATWKDIRPPARLFGLVAGAGAICWLAVPRLSGQDSVPWVAVGASVALAAGLLAVIGYVSRRELRELVETARGAKKD